MSVSDYYPSKSASAHCSGEKASVQYPDEVSSGENASVQYPNEGSSGVNDPNYYPGYADLISYMKNYNHKSYRQFLNIHRNVIAASPPYSTDWGVLNSIWNKRFLTTAKELNIDTFETLKKKVRPSRWDDNPTAGEYNPTAGEYNPTAEEYRPLYLFESEVSYLRIIIFTVWSLRKEPVDRFQIYWNDIISERQTRRDLANYNTERDRLILTLTDLELKIESTSIKLSKIVEKYANGQVNSIYNDNDVDVSFGDDNLTSNHDIHNLSTRVYFDHSDNNYDFANANKDLNANNEPDSINASDPNANKDLDSMNASDSNANNDPESMNASDLNANKDLDSMNASDSNANNDPDSMNASDSNANNDPDSMNASDPNANNDPDFMNASDSNANNDPDSMNASGPNANNDPDSMNASDPNANNDPDSMNASELNANNDPDSMNASDPNANNDPDSVNASNDPGSANANNDTDSANANNDTDFTNANNDPDSTNANDPDGNSTNSRYRRRKRSRNSAYVGPRSRNNNAIGIIIETEENENNEGNEDDTIMDSSDNETQFITREQKKMRHIIEELSEPISVEENELNLSNLAESSSQIPTLIQLYQNAIRAGMHAK
ncbi:2503_t:CDS:2, partial [Acaulospora morrowiae]